MIKNIDKKNKDPNILSDEEVSEYFESKKFSKYNNPNIPEHNHRGTEGPIDYKDLIGKPLQIHRTSVAVDLSGSATTLVCLHTERAAELVKAYLLYTEASSADAGITVEIGKESDRDYYYTGTTEASKALWYTKELTLLKRDVAAGDTVTFYSPGGKTGTGEIILVIEVNFIKNN